MKLPHQFGLTLLVNLAIVLLVPLSQPAQAESLSELHKRAYALEGQGKPVEEEALWQEIVRQFPGNVTSSP